MIESLLYQQTMERTLTQDIPKVVKSIENPTKTVRKKIFEVERRAEVRRHEWEEHQERWKREENQ